MTLHFPRLLPATLCALLHAPLAWPADFPLLAQPAQITPKALSAATLAIARAGSRLVAVGERGTILLSDDGGAHWRQARVPVSVSLTAVRFVDEKSGWAVGHLGVILRSADGGETWVKQLDGREAAQRVLDAAKASGDDKAMASAQALVDDGPDKPFLDLWFDDANTGYVIGAYGLILRTDDAGKSWQAWGAHVANPKGLHLYGMRRAGNALVIAGEQGLLLRSTDGGQRFERIASPYKGSYFGLVAGREGELVAFGLRGNAWRSTDGGASWQKVETGVEVGLSAGTALADGGLALVSQAGDLLVSRDGGERFARVAAAQPLPFAGLAQAADGTLVAASLRGVKRLDALRP